MDKKQKPRSSEWVREKLPNERAGFTHQFIIRAGDDVYEGYITTGLYADGRLGEIFVKMDRQGSQVSGFLDSWAIAVSLLLQMGMPVDDIARKYSGMSFQPSGITDNPKIRFAQSPVDYIARYLKLKFGSPEEKSD